MPQRLTVDDVAGAVPGISCVSYVTTGGQKDVFRGTIDGAPWAVKFLRPILQSTTPGATAGASVNPVADDVTARAEREVNTMRECNTPHLVKVGPIGLQSTRIAGDDWLYFTEEYIEGLTLSDIIAASGPLAIGDVVRLGLEMSQAIEALWQLDKIHRDIKPGNIMRRTNGGFVLLDMGLVFDLHGQSYSLGPVGTFVYFSPEQMDFANRRTVLDFRSDTFSLGIVLYQAATGLHPFAHGAQNSWDIMNNIVRATPTPPRTHRQDIPLDLEAIILRLLAKRPALRYRRIRMLSDALQAVQFGGP